ncbi:MAG: DNA translocase FtsK [Clostridiales bacterium]|nr:DNA translocase FtsK [Clostridiales bacterium]
MGNKTKRAKRNTKTRNKNTRIHELIGIIIIGLGLFAILSVYSESAGEVGKHFGNALRGLFGIIAYIVPIFIIFTGILVVVSYNKAINKSKLFLVLFFFVLSFPMIHLFYIKEFNSGGLWSFITDSYSKGIEVRGTGAIFSPLTYYVFKWFGLLGSYLFLGIVIILDLLILTNLSIKQLGINIYDRLNEKKIANQRNREEKIKPKTRAFTGEIIDLNSLEETGEDQESLKEAFDRRQAAAESEKYIDEGIKIVDYGKAVHDQASKGNKDDNTALSSDDPSQDLDITPSYNALDKSIEYSMPPLELLKEPDIKKESKHSSAKVRNRAKLLEDTLMSFGISAKVVQVSKGPAITRYELQPAPGVKVSRIVSLSDDIALNLAASGVRIEAPIPGKAAVGVEVPNQDISPVLLREVLESEAFTCHPSKVCFGLGKDIAGKPMVVDIARMPHLLIAGATGSGKSVCINSLLTSILYKSSPEEVKLILIDPKVVELNHFNGIPHLLVPVVTDPKKAAGALNWAVQEMVSRYKLFADKGVKDIHGYNNGIQVPEENRLPQTIIVVDELSDLMMVAPNEVEDSICRLAQMARAAGIHLVIATQRPSVDVITGLIKANIPSRIAFATSSHTDSRTILDMGGAEKLLGNGDMLFYPMDASKPIRVKGSFISEQEIAAVVDYIKASHESPAYDIDLTEEIAVSKDEQSNDLSDELLPQAVEIVIDAGQASISMLQRRLRIGYARAARMIDEMEVRGIVSGFDGSKPRNVLITREEFYELYGD